jgi:hypothetical protein
MSDLIASNQLGKHPLDVLGDSDEVATFGSFSSNTFIRMFDRNTYANSYYIGKSNNILYITKDNGGVNVGIGTSLPMSSAALQVQGTLLTSNIGTYLSSGNIGFNNQNISGISNISFTGNMFQNNQPFKTSQWTTAPSSNIFIGQNVTIGSNADLSGASSNVVVVGDMLVTGQMRVQNINTVVPLDGTGQFSSLTIYEIDVINNYKNIMTNDTNILNRVLYNTNMTPGRYMINGNILFRNLNRFGIFDNTNWAQIELYKLSPTALAAANPRPNPMRVIPVTAISENEIENIPFNWLVDLSDNFNVDVTIVVSGKGHSLQFLGNSDTSTGSYVAVMPIKGLGYDQNILVNQALQVNPIRLTTVVTTSGVRNFMLPPIDGYFTLNPSQVDVYVNGVKRYYYGPGNIANQYTVVENGYSSDLKSTFTVVFTENALISERVDIIAWPRATASSYYTSGYLYQTINTNTSPWQLVTDGGVRIGNKVVIDGDLYVQGSIWGGCNTNGFMAGVMGTGVTPIDGYSNIIGNYNLSDGAVTAAKLNLVSGNVGIGTQTATQPLHVNGQALFSSNVFVNGKTSDQRFMVLDLTTGGVVTGTNIYSFRAPYAISLYQTPRITVTTPSSSGNIVVNVRTGSESATTAAQNVATNLTLAAGALSTGASSPFDMNIADDNVITFDVASAGAGAFGLKATLYYRHTF